MLFKCIEDSTEASAKISTSLELNKGTNYSMYEDKLSRSRKINISKIRKNIAREEAQYLKETSRSRPYNEAMKSWNSIMSNKSYFIKIGNK